MRDELAGFIKFLENNDLVEFDILGDGDAKFTNRLKLQKYTFLAERYGMPLGYRYDMYLYGPYSRGLTADYYSLARDTKSNTDSLVALPARFRREDFLRDVKDDPGWLEVATTIIDRNGRIRERAALAENVWHMKSQFGRRYIEEVLDDLEGRRLVSFDTVA